MAMLVYQRVYPFWEFHKWGGYSAIRFSSPNWHQKIPVGVSTQSSINTIDCAPIKLDIQESCIFLIIYVSA